MFSFRLSCFKLSEFGQGSVLFMNYRILVADDHPLFRAAIKQIMSVQLENVSIDETDSVSGLQKQLEDNQDADLILLDLHMPGAQGFSALVFLRNHYPEIPVVVISAQEDPVVINRAMHFGAAGFIPKSAEPKTIKEAIETVLAGDLWSPEPVTNINERSQYEQEMAEKLASLTPSQFKVLVMMNEGLISNPKSKSTDSIDWDKFGGANDFSYAFKTSTLRQPFEKKLMSTCMLSVPRADPCTNALNMTHVT